MARLLGCCLGCVGGCFCFLFVTSLLSDCVFVFFVLALFFFGFFVSVLSLCAFFFVHVFFVGFFFLVFCWGFGWIVLWGCLVVIWGFSRCCLAFCGFFGSFRFFGVCLV